MRDGNYQSEWLRQNTQRNFQKVSGRELAAAERHWSCLHSHLPISINCKQFVEEEDATRSEYLFYLTVNIPAAKLMQYFIISK